MNSGVKLRFYSLAPFEMLLHNDWDISWFDAAIPSLFRNNPHRGARTTLSLTTRTRHGKTCHISCLKGGKHCC